ncbi:MAG: CPBP family intramembrane metalloprotease [Spirochaetales bacterium]|nr:CPBP family intramembrane metalloprotease [Spirochaetales bacterium]
MKKILLERRLLILAAAVFGMIGYIYLTPPVSQSSLAAQAGIRTGWGENVEMYVQRFALAFLLLGALPGLAARISGYRLRDLGVRKPRLRFAPAWLAAALVAGGIVGLAGASSPALAEYYPYDSGLAERVAQYGAWPFLAHLGAYFFFYYLPWELLFRGVLIFSLLDESIDNATTDGKTLFIASIQVIPSALLHIGHPAAESVGAVFLGFAAAWVTVKTKSIAPVLLFHAAAGIFLDLAIVLRAG